MDDLVTAKNNLATINRKTRFGPTDQYRFNDETNPFTLKSSHIGVGKIGKPSGHRLRSATITITLHESILDTRLHRKHFGRRLHITPSNNSQVQMTNYFAPHSLAGEKHVTTYEEETSLMPTVDAGGIAGLGGLGWKRKESGTKTDYWWFKGYTRSSPEGTYLEWQLEGTQSNGPRHPPKFHTAFAFNHTGKAASMHVKVEGRLKKRYQDIGRSLYNFRSKPIIMDIDLSLVSNYKRDIEVFAMGLREEMEQENEQEAPREMTERFPPNSKDETPSARLQDDLSGSTVLSEDSFHNEREEGAALRILNSSPFRRRPATNTTNPWANHDHGQQHKSQHAKDELAIEALRDSDGKTKATIEVPPTPFIVLVFFYMMKLLGLDSRR
ncbi:hypothetical protein JMJ77_0003954 [Colletotrichum scovillei]|uniref:Uncharacterized protein n=1 Tax=Colletotrichum scovillei TaxID=1209932 RepID=A0A9P7QWJ0_9PEZI|nr:hypothetical protein JMJ77_0003954 [Colletotrichum scovillei]KAG7049202.1 hypothetical protein JMJ78_0013185 [Colletotrichum scovillei]KAG7063944.1 hypothetical protein JMJ76_0006992 [Colletotrichum scovillei]